MVLDGSTVHNIGDLQMHVGNWGNFRVLAGLGCHIFRGAVRPVGLRAAASEYLFVAGLWVGAIKSDVPAVSTSAYSWEFPCVTGSARHHVQNRGGCQKRESPSLPDG